MRPNQLVVQAYLARGACLWLATRGVLTAIFLLAGINPVSRSAGAVVEIILLSVAIGFLDIHVRRERAFLANLSVRPLVLSTCFAGPALLGEVALRLGVAVLQ